MLGGKGKRTGTRERAEQHRAQHAPGRLRQRRHIKCTQFARRLAAGRQQRRGVRAAVGERDLLGHGEDAMGGGDEQRAIRRDEAAFHRPRGLHQLGGEHDIDVPRHGHQREHRLAPGRLRRRFGEQFDVVDRRAGALGDAGNGGRLREIAAVLGKIDDPVRQYAAALAAQRNDRDGDRPRRQRSGVHLARHAAARRASMRRCRAPITALRSLCLNRSHAVGLAMIEAR
jgi:hypothetical protein